ncbi:hypothetical protein HN51_039834 [Arachis hypogaea]|uniref:Uncharacterized protein n=1 Tax=Arachis hypogaea TaxID=3818 RepID=A0A444YLA0_ARAHY|nr:protein trichome birefringence-like 25 [Arachis ipaensis]XP_020959827.1 protein trichome birefringence-like 25 [Arachis ipaensis]XP_025663284.1 protein trichome birefringence-like 25 [Arachis hypogaea]QHN85451.1 Protein trichome birefringence-like [Arachis hypogaea]RYR02629.1 hypothetical protein Ahy_B06g081429 [Arachis hypogaea]
MVRSELKKQSNNNHVNVIVIVLIKLALSCLLLGLAIHLLFFFSDSSHNELLRASTNQTQTAANNNVDEQEEEEEEKCDLFVGDWVADPSPPLYTNESCLLIEDHQNCMRNGRPDSEFLYWRWAPRACGLPRFSPTKFLHMMRDKSWAFIGDSICRNHVQSLLCILSQIEAAQEVYHDEEFKSKIWKFPSYNFTLSVIWTPFLIKADIFEDSNGVSSSEIQLHLDTLDHKWTNQYHNFDYVVIAGGKWFLKTAIYHENRTVRGCHYCPGKNLTELGFDYAYRKALRQVFHFLTNSNHKATVFFRTTTPDHFENGEWFSGGYCNRTVPFKEDQVRLSDVDSIMRGIELQELEKATAWEHGARLKLLDTTRLALLRPDGHPGPYRQFHPFANDMNAKIQNDCLHWCLPGPIDSWNDILLQMLLNARS